MRLVEIQKELRNAVEQAARSEFGVEIGQIAIETPPKTELGDLALPVAFELAKEIKKATGEKSNPREIAGRLTPVVEALEFVERVELAGPGYLNVFVKRDTFLESAWDRSPLPDAIDRGRSGAHKMCVEHTSLNPNKAAHIGHLRNAVLGDTFHRILRATGESVEVQNYIDNTGVQVADVVVGFIHLEKMDLAAIKELDAKLTSEGGSFDYYCWDLYSQVGKQYQSDEELLKKRAEVLHLLEEGGNETAELADFVAMRNVECMIATMERLSIRYDLLPRESEILHLHFWQHAFEKMKELGAIHFETEGKSAGCWVMPFDSHSGTDEHESDKILVRSNGTVTYTGKDIAYQMWKLGLLDMDFFYRRFHAYANGREVWTTADHEQPNQPSELPQFGHGDVVYNVIDSRQSYTQDVVRKGVAAISPEKGERASIHLAYEMVALSPAAAEELGFTISDEDRKRPFIEMSGRKGLGVKADDLIDRLEVNAAAEVEKRHPDLAADERARIAHQIAVGALRYFLLKFTRNTIIVFDFKEALSFEGETGVFCQYSAVRANSIFRKLGDAGKEADGKLDGDRVREVFSGTEGDDIWSLVMLAARLEETVVQAAAQGEPATVARFAFNLAKAFNLFYHNHKIVSESHAVKKQVLIRTAAMARDSLTSALATLGIEVPERM
jgi:arginyl-tRNA synthetase